MMNWWNVIKQAGGIMSSGSASAGTESEKSYSGDWGKNKYLEGQARKDGRIIYRCRFCSKQFNNKLDKDACEKECLDKKYPDTLPDDGKYEFW